MKIYNSLYVCVCVRKKSQVNICTKCTNLTIAQPQLCIARPQLYAARPQLYAARPQL